ncbi:Tropomodulin-2 [Manis pentadactyla]|nr:Tropomodulin-2 [Manis pentadactyla]
MDCSVDLVTPKCFPNSRRNLLVVPTGTARDGDIRVPVTHGEPEMRLVPFPCPRGSSCRLALGTDDAQPPNPTDVQIRLYKGKPTPPAVGPVASVVWSRTPAE